MGVLPTPDWITGESHFRGLLQGTLGESLITSHLTVEKEIFGWWGWAPPLEYIPFIEDPLGSLAGLFIPGLILGTASAAATMRMTRTMMLEVFRQDYIRIRTAWAKGLKERVVVMRHAIKNALIPVVTLIGLQLPILVGGSVIIETIFNLPGIGRLIVFALTERDYPVVSGANLFFATGVLGVNLMIDIIYFYLDPRVRYS